MRDFESLRADCLEVLSFIKEGINQDRSEVAGWFTVALAAMNMGGSPSPVNSEEPVNKLKTTAVYNDEGYFVVPDFNKARTIDGAEKKVEKQFEDQTDKLPVGSNAGLSTQQIRFKRSCTSGKMIFPIAYGNGAANATRVDDENVSIRFELEDLCFEERERQILMSLEFRDSREEEFEEVKGEVGIIESVPPQSAYNLFAERSSQTKSCLEKPDQQYRYVMSTVTRSDELKVRNIMDPTGTFVASQELDASIRVQDEKPLPIIRCS